MSSRLPVRSSGQARRRARPRRASARLSPRRAAAGLLLVLAAGAGWGVTASSAFAVRDVAIEGTALTAQAAVSTALALPDPAPNAFTLRTDALRAQIRALPAVASVEVRVVLPGSLRVRIAEREPILAWRAAGRLLLVDRDGRVLADAAGAAATAAAVAAAAHLPTIDDRRVEREPPDPGGTLDAVDLEVARRLLSLRPADLGSAAPGLIVTVDDADGWLVLPAVEDPWTAVFGIYTPSLRPADLVPEQVRLLRSLMVAKKEATILRVVLAGPDSGTYVGR